MKINSNNVLQFLKNFPQDINAALIYGPDHGLVREIINSFKERIVGGGKDPFQYADYSYDKIKGNLSLFFEAVASMSFTGVRKLIVLYEMGASLPPSIQEFLKEYKGRNFVIIVGEDLPPSASSRKFFESGKNTVAIACYKDDQAMVKTLIKQRLHQNGFTYDNEVLLALESYISGDRALIINEIERLITYMGDNNHITLEDIEEIRIGPVETSLDTFCHAFASLQMAQASSLMNQLQGEGVNIIGILRSLAKYFLRLYYVRSKIDAGIKEAEAISSLTPPLFFKHIPTFTHHVKKWNNDKIILLLEELSELEVKCKKTGAPTNLLCEHLIYKWSCNTYILKANNVEKA